MARGDPLAMPVEGSRKVVRDFPFARHDSSSGGGQMLEQQRIAHLKGSTGLGPKCGTTDASIVTNWVLGATYREIYVPADVLQRADQVCGRCQEAALNDESGSDDEVLPDDEDTTAESAAGDDPAFAEVSDQRLLRELARRLHDAADLAEEESDEAKDERH